MTFTLRYLGDPVLEQPCTEVKAAEEIPGGLLAAMREVLARYRGAGLAAPQLGVPLCVALVRIAGRDVVVVNPRLEKRSPESQTEDEGCLSIPNFYMPLPRAQVVAISFQDEDLGERRRVNLRGYEARIAQHEIDHMKGVLITTGAPRHFRRQAERAVAAFHKKVATV